MVLINPSATELGRRHVILWGRGRSRYYAADIPGPLSIKSVVRGQAEWSTSEGRFPLDATSLLLLNEDQRYTIAVDQPEPAETFVVFFERSFLSGKDSLDDPFTLDPAPGFFESIQHKQGPIAARLNTLYRGVSGNPPSPEWLEDQIHFLAEDLGAHLRRIHGEPEKIQARRTTTRLELYRRLDRARNYMESSLADSLSLDAVAREACLARFHFHRHFRDAFGETPQQYKTRRRLERAASLLHGTSRPVLEICLDCGFDSLGSFTTLFARRYGAPPGRYRQIRKNREVFFPGSAASYGV